MRMQRMSYSAGDIVIRQGDEGDYFYAIVDGRCVVTRETPLNREGVKLAELGKGDTFGEEALISGAKRNATVSMLTDGVVMRLGKDDFNTLLNEPMLQWVDVEEARALIGRGARWLDVRLPSEYEHVAFRRRAESPAVLRAPQAQDARYRRVLRSLSATPDDAVPRPPIS